MKSMKINISFLLLVLTIISCSKFDEINSNPDSPETSSPSLLATNLILNIARSSGAKGFILPQLTSKQMAWGEMAQSEVYNSIGSVDFSGARVLINAQKMVDLASESDKDAYTGLALFIKAYKFYYLTISVGDIPYTEALKGEEGLIKPKYDTQKDVMINILNDLALSSTHFAKAKNFAGDPLLNGNVDKWRRIVNSFRLKVLISLSKKETDSDLNIKDKFANIIQNEPILESNNDNFQLVYSNRANQLYPWNTVTNKFVIYPMISTTIIDTLQKYNDYRLFYYAAPSEYQLANGKLPSDPTAYLGVDPSIVFSDLTKLFTDKKYSKLNSRYSDYEPGEPIMKIGYPEQNFIIAEAIVRGWVAGNAKEYYEKGITAAMTFIANATPDDNKYHSGKKITESYIRDIYLKDNNVLFSSNSTNQLQQIWMQKYLLYFLQHDYESYYEYRRTGYPLLPINPQSSINIDDKTIIPKRYTYGNTEYSYNLDNLKEALQRQFNGDDKSNGIMWILK